MAYTTGNLPFFLLFLSAWVPHLGTYIFMYMHVYIPWQVAFLCTCIYLYVCSRIYVYLCRCPYYPARLLRPSLIRPRGHEHVGRPVPVLPAGIVVCVCVYVYILYDVFITCIWCLYSFPCTTYELLYVNIIYMHA